MIRITNIVIFSLLVFCFGIYAAVNIDTKMTEGKTSHEITIWQKMMDKRRVYQMLKKKVIEDNGWQNEQSITDGKKISGLQNNYFECIWNNPVLTCNITVPRLQTFSVILRMSEYVVRIIISADGEVIKSQILHIHSMSVKTLKFILGSASVLFTICIDDYTENYLKACFHIVYSVFFYRKSLYVGCFHKHFLSSQNISLDSVKDSLQFSDIDKFRSLENNVGRNKKQNIYLCFFMED
ncbi:uncharacterized protein LOC115227064 [Octopus sinensis]|uniref:Uncharacterized protein LOC115227064 n=1 Tax=Octopus sinensis TaxID=2607531 RepID=A0A6P7TP09_9MOLL|nr:uncharacterized protein LOC115227064 [Octopus sinensis]